MNAASTPEALEFGDVTVDLRRVEVRRAGKVVPLEPKSFDVLRHLLENRDRLVTKDELLDVVWNGTFVTPNVLTRAVAQLRKALGDDAFEARYIETVAKRGYRFIAPVGVTGNGESREGARLQDASEPAAGPKPVHPAWVRRAVAGLAIATTLTAASLWLRAPDRTAPGGEAAPLIPRRLTVAAGSYRDPAISPDGSTVAYVSRRAGKDEIVVAGLAPGSQEVTITSDGGGNVRPAFSPDGLWLAYHSKERGGIWVVPSTGGTPRQVADFGSEPSWAPDNLTLVFTATVFGQSSQGVLWTVRRDGSPPTPLTSAGKPPGGHEHPAWSHDGRLIAFKVGSHEAREIWIVRAEGGDPWRLAALPRDSSPRFAPDDRGLYWIGHTAERSDCLIRMRLGPDGAPDGKPECLLPFIGEMIGEGVGPLSIARNGTAVFSWNRISVDLFAVDVGELGAPTPPIPLTFDEAINAYPDYSPDGRIAFEQRRAGSPAVVWVMDGDGQHRELASPGLSVSVRAPQWDAEGGRLLTRVEPGADEPPYFGWIDLATRRLTRIPIASQDRANQPSLSPDGGRLAFHLIGPDGALNVWVQALDGGVPRQITFDREAVSYPRWSQDGKWLAVNVKRDEEIHVGVVSAEGGPLEQLTSGPGVRWPYSFSPDGDQIAFSGDELRNIFAVSRSTRVVRQLTRFTSGSARFPAWSPRGDRIVFARGGSTGRNLWTLKLPD